jgi:threonine/homoserine/homoserine lactone efflux protein
MPSWTTFLAFSLATLALLVIPGPSVLFVVTRSIEQGTRAGIASVAGGTLGNVVHVIAAVAGLSAILAASAAAFNVVKWAGAAYLVYLGIQTLLSREAPETVEVGPRRPLRTIAAQGAVVYLLNPKIALFFLAIFPQFVDPARGDVSRQFLALGIIYCTLAFLSDSTYAALAGHLSRVLATSPRVRRFRRWGTGGIYLALGLTTALGSPARK